MDFAPISYIILTFKSAIIVASLYWNYYVCVVRTPQVVNYFNAEMYLGSAS